MISNNNFTPSPLLLTMIFAEKDHDADLFYGRRYNRLRIHLFKDPWLVKS